MRMRRFGWTLVLMQVVAAAVFLVMAYWIEADLENAQVEKHANILSDPTLQRYRPDLVADALVEIRGERWAETLYLFLGFGAGGLALVSAVIMAATAVRPEHPAGRGCTSCGVAIGAGMLCDDCRAWLSNR